MKTLTIISLLLLSATLVKPVRAVTMRYALIVGNNVGTDANGTQPLPPLLYAEKEATLLKEQLVGLSNFDTSQKRTRLLTGPTVKEVKAAFKELAEQKARDQALFETMESIFLLYYTGHGMEGRLLLRDAPLSVENVKDLFNSVNADFSVGIFDACYAGSFDSVLKEKGIRAAPGLDIGQYLPEEVLSAKGSVWYVSSGPGQPSYEHEELGGVFTHFFIEALTEAPQEGPGITLERIWQYVRENTAQYTASLSRTQVPEQFVSKLRSKAPVYFSFPVPRSATLVLTEELSGRFALTYAGGHLTEVFEKRAGEERAISIYPGQARLLLLDNGDSPTEAHTFTLSENGTLVIHAMPNEAPRSAVGERATLLSAKGAETGRLERSIALTRLEPAVSLLMGAGYTYSFTSDQLLHPRHRFAVPFRFDWGNIFVVAAGVFGFDRQQHPAWGFRARMAGGTLGTGYGWDIGDVRMSVKGAVSAAHLWQHFDSGREKTGLQWQPTLELGALLFKNQKAVLEIFANGGPLYSPGAGQEGQDDWFVFGSFGAVVYFRLM